MVEIKRVVKMDANQVKDFGKPVTHVAGASSFPVLSNQAMKGPTAVSS